MPARPSNAILEARRLLRDGRIAEAAASCRQLLQTDPDDAEALNLSALVAHAQGRDGEAVAQLERALSRRPSAAYWVNLGSIHARMKRLKEAEAAYRQAIDLDRSDATAHGNLGILLHRLGHLGEAREVLARGVELGPKRGDVHLHLGAVLYALGRLEEALAADGRALELVPRSLDARTRRGAAFRKLGRLDEALVEFEAARALDDKSWTTQTNIGSVLRELGRPADAVDLYRSAIALRPNAGEAHLGLALSLIDLGGLAEALPALRRASQIQPTFTVYKVMASVLIRLDKAEEACVVLRRAIELRADHAEGHMALAEALRKLARLAEACASYRTALAFAPEDAETWHGLALSLRGLGRLAESRELFEKTLQLKPDRPEFHNNYANLLRDLGRYEDACNEYRSAAGLKDNYPEAITNLATTLKDQGKLDEAVAEYERALTVTPDLHVAHANLAFALAYVPGTTLATLDRIHRAWHDRFAAPLKARWPVWRPAGSREKPRVGFVSADFNSHPVGYFTIQAVEGLRRRGFEVFCYANQTRDDALSARFQAASTWRPIAGLSDDAAAEQIRADGIDILFDLSGFTSGNRMLIFARKPAPIQATWFGYISTTGLEAMDYIIADRHHIPAASEKYYREKVVVFPDSYSCFDPPNDAPDPGPLPAIANGYVTFGSFNVLCKITPQVVELWSRILGRLPSSRLVMKTAALTCPATRARYADLFAGHGIDPARVTFLGRTSRAEHLAATASTDIALDSFPYVGGATTVECGWMGVPVVTRPGEVFSSRHSFSYLSTIGLTEIVAETFDDYADIAVSLAQDLPRLAALRGSLRQQILTSPLCNSDAFAAYFAFACRHMWQSYQTGQPPQRFAIPRAPA